MERLADEYAYAKRAAIPTASQSKSFSVMAHKKVIMATETIDHTSSASLGTGQEFIFRIVGINVYEPY